MRVRITRLRSTHDKLRTDSVEGDSMTLPRAGGRVVVVGQPLTPGADHRVVTTSEVRSVFQDNGAFLFTTLNSTYRMELLDEEEPTWPGADHESALSPEARAMLEAGLAASRAGLTSPVPADVLKEDDL